MCPFFSCPVTPIPAESPNLWDIEQSQAEFRRQEKPAFQMLPSFFFRTNHFIFSFSIPWDENLGEGGQREIFGLFLLLLLFHLGLETWPCGYSQNEIYSPVPCQLLTASDSPVSFTAAVNSHTLLAVGLHPNLLGQCLTASYTVMPARSLTLPMDI